MQSSLSLRSNYQTGREQDANITHIMLPNRLVAGHVGQPLSSVCITVVTVNENAEMETET